MEAAFKLLKPYFFFITRYYILQLNCYITLSEKSSNCNILKDKTQYIFKAEMQMHI